MRFLGASRKIGEEKALSLQRKTGKHIFVFCTTKLIEMFKTLLFTLLIIAISVALLAIKVIIKKNGRFPNTHVGGNKEMRRRGIKCVQSQDRDARKHNPMSVKENR